jgi:hypothetical protein
VGAAAAAAPDFVTLQLLGPVRSWKRDAGPDRRTPHALVILERQIGAADDGLGVKAGFEDQHRMHALFASNGHADDRRVSHARLGGEGALDVLREHLHPLSGRDQLLLAALDLQSAAGVHLADIAGVEPPVAQRRHLPSAGRVVVPGRDVVASDQDLAVVGDLDRDAADRRSHGPLGRLERVIQRDDGRRFGEPVALNDEKAQRAPEVLEVGFERRGAADHTPEFPAEQAMRAPVVPPATKKMLAREQVRSGGFRQHALDMVAQHLEDFGDADEDGHPP